MRHPVFISPLDALNLAAEEEKAVGETFIIEEEKEAKISELIEKFSHILGKKKKLKISIPFWLAKGVAASVEKAGTIFNFDPPSSKRSLKFFTTNSSFDISKSKPLLGFIPKLTLTKGLR